MILIADSGSTKTDWRLITNSNQIHQFSTIGFNPYFQTTTTITTELQKVLLPEFQKVKVNEPLSVFFYGAGCSSPDKVKIVSDALETCFPKAMIEVQHDLLAAARALCGERAGIAAILGTGSNSCYYDGRQIVENVPSLGYLLGDEGSGAHIGKTFIKLYLENEVPGPVSDAFHQRFQLTRDDILHAVYKQPMPNKFLASFSKFVYQQLQHPFVSELVADCFRQFFTRQICKYSLHRQVPFNCVGSVGFYFSNILRATALEKNIIIGTILESPIAGLTLYHTPQIL